MSTFMRFALHPGRYVIRIESLCFERGLLLPSCEPAHRFSSTLGAEPQRTLSLAEWSEAGPSRTSFLPNRAFALPVALFVIILLFFRPPSSSSDLVPGIRQLAPFSPASALSTLRLVGTRILFFNSWFRLVLMLPMPLWRFLGVALADRLNLNCEWTRNRYPSQDTGSSSSSSGDGSGAGCCYRDGTDYITNRKAACLNDKPAIYGNVRVLSVWRHKL